MASFEKRLSELHELLRHALKLELSTIPPYATACFSIKEEGQYDRSDPHIVNAEPIEVIRQVMVEEMLHMVLVANVLNAIGGKPVLDDRDWIPTYPCHLLPSGKGPIVHLRRFSPEQIKAFREIERAPPNFKHVEGGDCYNAETIGGFYHCIVEKLNGLCRDSSNRARVFCGDRDRQIDRASYYGAGGEIIIVHDLDTANQALHKIIDEGEGADCGDKAGDKDPVPGEDREDIAHFFKFNEIYCSRYYRPDDRLGEPPTGADLIVDWSAVWPMKDDLKVTDVKDVEIRAKIESFNQLYSDLLRALNEAFNGKPDRLAQTVHEMYRLKYAAQELMRIPINAQGETAGPMWEYVEP